MRALADFLEVEHTISKLGLVLSERVDAIKTVDCTFDLTYAMAGG
jgi:hypothetical protein